MDENQRYQKAKERVEELKGFYIHLIVYVLVNLFLFVLNMLTSPRYLWFYWPLIGWGIGVVGHAFSVIGKGWEDRKIKELMQKMKEEEEK